VQRKLDRLADDMQKRVIPAALNKVAAKAKTEMTRAITSEYNIQRGDVAGRLRVTRAGRKIEQWVATLDPFASRRRGRSLNLIRFVEKKVTLAEGRRRKKAGTQDQLRFQIKKVGGKKIITGAFIANKGRTVFIREGKDRLPIKALSTIDVPSMFNARRIRGRVEQRIRQELAVEFDRAINAVLARRI
jgi:hypothetical protein